MNPIRAKLLIVDQSEPMRSAMRDLMHDLAFVRIDEAPDAQAALLLVKSNHYDLMLCEWRDAGFSALDLVRFVRHSPVGSDTPVVLISADGAASRTVEALEAGANGFLARPFSTSRLCEKVMRIISAHPPVSDFSRTPKPDRPDREDTWRPFH